MPGGRRHGLNPEGPAQRLLLALSDEDRQRLEELAARWGCTLSEAVRRCVRDVADSHAGR